MFVPEFSVYPVFNFWNFEKNWGKYFNFSLNLGQIFKISSNFPEVLWKTVLLFQLFSIQYSVHSRYYRYSTHRILFGVDEIKVKQSICLVYVCKLRTRVKQNIWPNDSIGPDESMYSHHVLGRMWGNWCVTEVWRQTTHIPDYWSRKISRVLAIRRHAVLIYFITNLSSEQSVCLALDELYLNRL